MNRSTAPANPCEQALARWCERCEPRSLKVAVAYSAGADSTALLLAAKQRWPGRLVALHVHHGLQAAADGFEAQARAFCTLHGIDLHVSRVDAAHGPGESPEAVARDRRYATLASMAQQAGVDVVLLGQEGSSVWL